MIAYEAGYRAELSPRASLDVATFRNVYDELRSQEFPARRRASPWCSPT